jgi:DNA-binding response OmpR family regulator
VPATTVAKDAPTILIVDDEPAIRLLASRTLGGAGYRTLEAHDGETALREAALAKPDLVLLDFALPGANGLEVCRRLRDAHLDGSVLLLSGLPVSQAGEPSGVSGCIEKPFSPSSLLEHVAAALRSHSAQESPTQAP